MNACPNDRNASPGLGPRRCGAALAGRQRWRGRGRPRPAARVERGGILALALLAVCAYGLSLSAKGTEPADSGWVVGRPAVSDPTRPASDPAMEAVLLHVLEATNRPLLRSPAAPGVHAPQTPFTLRVAERPTGPLGGDGWRSVGTPTRPLTETPATERDETGDLERAGTETAPSIDRDEEAAPAPMGLVPRPGMIQFRSAADSRPAGTEAQPSGAAARAPLLRTPAGASISASQFALPPLAAERSDEAGVPRSDIDLADAEALFDADEAVGTAATEAPEATGPALGLGRGETDPSKLISDDTDAPAIDLSADEAEAARDLDRAFDIDPRDAFDAAEGTDAAEDDDSAEPRADGRPQAEKPVREAPVVKPLPPLTPQLANLRNRVRNVLKSYYRKSLNSRDNDPWEVMHGMLAYELHSRIHQGGPRGNLITSIGWLCYNKPCKELTLMYVTPEGELRAKQGVGLQGHKGQLLAMLAQCRVSPEYPIRVGEHEFKIYDLIEAEKKTCYPKTELTFKLIALTHYLDLNETWVNDEGLDWDIPRLIREELAQPIRGAACGGTHRLSGLSLAVQARRRRGEPLDGEYQRAAEFVQQYHNYAFRMQNRDGSLSTKWFQGRGDESDIDRRVKTTGHTLEWLVYSLSDEELREQRTIRAVNYLTTLLASKYNNEWEVGPLCHAIHALVRYDERVFKPYDQARDVAGGGAGSAPGSASRPVQHRNGRR